MKQDKHVAIVAIVCLTILQCTAMYYGINGTMRTIIFMLIAGIVGLKFETPAFLKGGI